VLARVYEMRDELKLFLEGHAMGNRVSFGASHQRISAALELPRGYFPSAY